MYRAKALVIDNPIPAGSVFFLLSLVLYLYSGSIFAEVEWMPERHTVTHLTDWRVLETEGCQAAGEITQNIFEALKKTSGAGNARLVVCDALNADARALPNARMEIGPEILRLSECEQTFILGHELAHIALGHADFEAHYLSALAKLPWPSAADAFAAADYNLALVFDLQETMKADEYEADWVGSMLAATQGCSLEMGAVSYFGREKHSQSSVGLIQTHDSAAVRIKMLKSWETVVEAIRTKVVPKGLAEIP